MIPNWILNYENDYFIIFKKFDKEIKLELEKGYLNHFYKYESAINKLQISNGNILTIDFKKMEILDENQKTICTLKRKCTFFNCLGIVIVVCRAENNKWLTIRESGNQGW